MDKYIFSPFSGGTGWAWRLHLFAVLLPLTGVISWLCAVMMRWVSRRLRRLNQPTAADVLSVLARPLRLVVLLSGLYVVVDLGWPTPGRHVAFLGATLFVLAVTVATFGLVRAGRQLLAAMLDRALARGDAEAVPYTRSRQALLPLGQRVVMVVLWLIALVVVLDHFGQSISSVVTALGVGSLAIGLAAQQALSNMIAGVVLLLDRPFRTGDRVRLPGLDIGRVEEMGLRSTHIRLADGNLLIVPNNDLVTAKLINYSGPDGVRGEVRLQVPATADVSRLGDTLLHKLKDDPGIQHQPAPRLMLLTVAEKLELSLTFLLAPLADAPTVEERLRRVVLGELQAPTVERQGETSG